MLFLIILSFKVYFGKEDDYDGTDVSVCDKLVDDVGLTIARGQILYTNNYYTSVKLAKLMYEKYGWILVGTISATEKKSRENEDIPFLKSSNSAMMGVKRG